jgi:hypothetical protein
MQAGLEHVPGGGRAKVEERRFSAALSEEYSPGLQPQCCDAETDIKI